MEFNNTNLFVNNYVGNLRFEERTTLLLDACQQTDRLISRQSSQARGSLFQSRSKEPTINRLIKTLFNGFDEPNLLNQYCGKVGDDEAYGTFGVAVSHDNLGVDRVDETAGPDVNDGLFYPKHPLATDDVIVPRYQLDTNDVIVRRYQLDTDDVIVRRYQLDNDDVIVRRYQLDTDDVVVPRYPLEPKIIIISSSIDDFNCSGIDDNILPRHQGFRVSMMDTARTYINKTTTVHDFTPKLEPATTKAASSPSKRSRLRRKLRQISQKMMNSFYFCQ